MFYVDKYRPNKPEESYFHKDTIKKLKCMSEDTEVPHMIFYGPPGSGKMTLINIFLNMLYDDHVNKAKYVEYSVSGSGSNVKNVQIQQSQYHIVIEPNNNNFYKYLIQEVVKIYAQKKLLNVYKSKHNFKVVLINNIDNMTYYAQTALRRTMEKYSTTCRFIMCSRSLSKVIDPLKSRCMTVRISNPTTDDIFGFLCYVASCEHFNTQLTLNDYIDIADRSDNSIKKALWLLQLKKDNIPYETTYDRSINTVCNMMMNKTTDISKIRKLLYNIMITNIPCDQIIKDILNFFMTNKKIDSEKKSEIMRIVSVYEHNIVRSRREILHLEAIIQKTINII
jgi:replication factor C subunit 3/5